MSQDDTAIATDENPWDGPQEAQTAGPEDQVVEVAITPEQAEAAGPVTVATVEDNQSADPVDPEVATVPAAAPAEEAKSSRGPRTNLEVDLFNVIAKLVTGGIVLDADVKPTPHTLARLVHEARNSEASAAGTENKLNAPSSGAVSACLDRWAEIGFVTLGDKPKAFADFTDEGRTIGLTALKERHHTNLLAARKAEKAASAPVVTTPAPEAAAPVVADEATATAEETPVSDDATL